MTDIVDASRGGLERATAQVNLAMFSSQSGPMQHSLELAHLACRSSAPIMISGENGTGKSLLAMAIHNSSNRRSRPCVTLDCLALSARDIKRRLFGEDSQAGLFEQAGGGTLIIDDVDLFPGFIQKELLGFLRENGRLRAATSDSLGGRLAGARLIATSGGERARKPAASLLIEDLLYYLGEITIRIPPLRERREDIADLTAAAIAAANSAYGKRVGGLSRTASDFIRHYSFPGNVRELFLIIDQAVKGTDRDTVYVEDLGQLVDSMEDDPHLFSDMTIMPLAELEKRHIGRALLRTGWKKRAAARILRINLSQLERKIKLYELEENGQSEDW